MTAPRRAARLRRLDPERLAEHVDHLYRAAWALCGHPHDAEDLVQETYARVLARPRWLRHGDDFGYLVRALRNAHVSRVRREVRRGREAIVMIDVAGLSYREAAKALGIKEATVTTRLYRARRAVAAALAPTDDSVPSSA